MDSLSNTYEKLVVQISAKKINHPVAQEGLESDYKYDVKSALNELGGYLNSTERNKIDSIVLDVLIRNLQ